MSPKIVSTVPNRSGAVINVVEKHGPDRLGWECTGCGSSNGAAWGYSSEITQEAQKHANACSFLPRK